MGREVPDDVGGVSSPEGNETLIPVGTGEAVGDTLVRGSQTTLLDLCHENSNMGEIGQGQLSCGAHHFILQTQQIRYQDSAR